MLLRLRPPLIFSQIYELKELRGQSISSPQSPILGDLEKSVQINHEKFPSVISQQLLEIDTWILAFL